jgi:hypothetical protein
MLCKDEDEGMELGPIRAEGQKGERQTMLSAIPPVVTLSGNNEEMLGFIFTSLTPNTASHPIGPGKWNGGQGPDPPSGI